MTSIQGSFINDMLVWSQRSYGWSRGQNQKKSILAAEKRVVLEFGKISGSQGSRARENVSVLLKKVTLRQKKSQALLFLERIFLFLDLDCQNLATLGFDNCPISENGKSLAEKATSALSFSTSEEVFSSCQEQLFSTANLGHKNLLNDRSPHKFN